MLVIRLTRWLRAGGAESAYGRHHRTRRSPPLAHRVALVA
uniref:Uncharacterized protein n=1 Tax=Rhizophora mucronata TaxID=61149 RepID=A0A2P2MW90_RHIMU